MPWSMPLTDARPSTAGGWRRSIPTAKPGVGDPPGTSLEKATPASEPLASLAATCSTTHAWSLCSRAWRAGSWSGRCRCRAHAQRDVRRRRSSSSRRSRARAGRGSPSTRCGRNHRRAALARCGWTRAGPARTVATCCVQRHGHVVALAHARRGRGLRLNLGGRAAGRGAGLRRGQRAGGRWRNCMWTETSFCERARSLSSKAALSSGRGW